MIVCKNGYNKCKGNFFKLLFIYLLGYNKIIKGDRL